jgi:ribonuclease P protein component
MPFYEPLKKNAAFRAVYGKGRPAGRNMLVIYAMKSPLEKTRFGISVSKKVGNAVKRNLVKRLIRENYRKAAPRVKKGYDIVAVARPEAGRMERKGAYGAIGSSLMYLLLKHGLLD